VIRHASDRYTAGAPIRILPSADFRHLSTRHEKLANNFA
jgi:hypothetical protein